MTCAELEISLCDYVDEAIGSEQRLAVEKHLAECVSCAQLARDVSASLAFVETVPPVEVPDELVTRLLFQVQTAKPKASLHGLRGFLRRWMEPVLQPRFAMGMAMTILSFSLLAKFAGIPERQLTPDDLHPAKVWMAVDDRFHQVWDRAVKYYDSLKIVYEVQSRLSEWSSEDEAAATSEPEATESGRPGFSPIPREGSAEPDERSGENE